MEDNDNLTQFNKQFSVFYLSQYMAVFVKELINSHGKPKISLFMQERWFINLYI